jgi:hypothetical protein
MLRFLFLAQSHCEILLTNGRYSEIDSITSSFDQIAKYISFLQVDCLPPMEKRRLNDLTNDKLRKELDKKKIVYKKNWTKDKLIDALWEKGLEIAQDESIASCSSTENHHHSTRDMPDSIADMITNFQPSNKKKPPQPTFTMTTIQEERQPVDKEVLNNVYESNSEDESDEMTDDVFESNSEDGCERRSWGEPKNLFHVFGTQNGKDCHINPDDLFGVVQTPTLNDFFSE